MHETTAVELVEQRKARMAAILRPALDHGLTTDPDMHEIHERFDAIRRLRAIGVEYR